MSKFRKM